VEWWSGGVVEWWSDGVLEWWSDGVLEWWSDGVLEWCSPSAPLCKRFALRSFPLTERAFIQAVVERSW
jgi:hypothetical protein